MKDKLILAILQLPIVFAEPVSNMQKMPCTQRR